MFMEIRVRTRKKKKAGFLFQLLHIDAKQFASNLSKNNIINKKNEKKKY